MSLLPHFLGRGDELLTVHPDHAQVLSRPVWLVVHPDVRRSPRVTLVAELLAELLEAAGPLLA